MSYAIIGFGNIGQALAKAFARNGSNLAGFRKVECLCRRAEIVGSADLKDLVKFD